MRTSPAFWLFIIESSDSNFSGHASPDSNPSQRGTKEGYRGRFGNGGTILGSAILGELKALGLAILPIPILIPAVVVAVVGILTVVLAVLSTLILIPAEMVAIIPNRVSVCQITDKPYADHCGQETTDKMNSCRHLVLRLVNTIRDKGLFTSRVTQLLLGDPLVINLCSLLPYAQ